MHLSELRFWWKFKTSGFSSNMRIDPIGFSLGPFGLSGLQQPWYACQHTDLLTIQSKWETLTNYVVESTKFLGFGKIDKQGLTLAKQNLNNDSSIPL